MSTDKRTNQKRDEQQVRVVVLIFVAAVVIGIISYVVSQGGSTGENTASSAGDPANAVDPTTLDLSGTPEEICDAATPAITADTRRYPDGAEQVLEADTDYQAIFCTSAGAIYVDLYEDRTPITVNNLVFLAQNNYYNNTIFHRVMEGFMAQGGDPTGTGSGGPGYQFEDETLADLTFDRPYLLAMANAGPGTNGSQFFITFEQTPWLNGLHTIFGEVISGQGAVNDIMLRDPRNPSAPATTLDALVIVTPDQVTQ
jgi:cyclophilin family peptidyl-prolyl cis-trans isomerase